MTRLVCLVLAACGHTTPASGDAAVDAPHGGDAVPRRRVAYVSGYGPDIAWFAVAANGTLAPSGSVAAFAASPSFAAIDPAARHLYAVSEATSRVGAYAIDPASGALTFIDDVASGGSGPAHVSVDPGGAFALVANYGDGAVAVLPIRSDGGLDPPKQTLAAGMMAHMIVTDAADQHAFVPCLGSDYVLQLDFDAVAGTLSRNAVPVLQLPAGTGPRHLAFAPRAPAAYVIDELASTVTALDYDAATGQLTARGVFSTRPPGATGSNTGAEIHVDPAERFVYASNRGDNTIARFAIESGNQLSLVDETATQGATPRDFTLDPDGTHLYVANQGSDNVVAFAIAGDGSLAPIGSPLAATKPAFVAIVELP